MASAWFGESLANITGQISNFTKEVLADTPEEDDDGGRDNLKRGVVREKSDDVLAEELSTTKKLVAELQAFAVQQRNEIDHFKLIATGFQDKSEALTLQNKSLTDSYQKLFESKDEENRQLTKQFENAELESSKKWEQQIEDVRLEERSSLQNRIEELQKECSELKSKAVYIPNPSIPSCSVEIQTEEITLLSTPGLSKELSKLDAQTWTDKEELQQEENEVEIVSGTANEVQSTEQDSYLRELEERCSAYQNDLYILRGELMTLQSDIDHNEEARAKLNEEIWVILHSDFILDGHSALNLPTKLRYGVESNDDEERKEQLLLLALRQLASIWRGLNDKKNALERAIVTSNGNKEDKANNTRNDVQIEELEEGEGEEFQNQQEGILLQEDFFPQRLDSFGLETIIEESKVEVEEPENVFLKKGENEEKQEVPLKLSNKIDISVQTEINEEEAKSKNEANEEERKKATELAEEELRKALLTKFETELKDKENQWSNQVEQFQTKIVRLESELGRLKNHLVDSEEQYTNEALQWEEKEKRLRAEITELQKQMGQIILQSERSKEVREEITRLETEKDFAIAQTKSYEDQVQKLGQQLQNLNFVLEQFQNEKEQELQSIRNELQREMNGMEIKNRTLNEELEREKEILDKARFGLDAARTLNLQIEEKSRIISDLKVQVQESEAEVMKLKKQLDEVANNNVAKIDRYLVKNLVVGYFSSPPDKRTEVLRIIATVLDFNREDRLKTGLESGSFWPFSKADGSSVSGTAVLDKKSLSEAFISFMEAESKPKTQIKIPMEEIATRKHSRTVSESSNSSAVGSSSTTTEISMNLPMFNQGDRSNSILKDVLNPRT